MADRAPCTFMAGRTGAVLPISPPVGEMPGRAEGARLRIGADAWVWAQRHHPAEAPAKQPYPSSHPAGTGASS